MKAIAKDIVVQNYNIVVTDEQVVHEQEKNRERGVHSSDDRVRRTIIKQRIVELIGDEKKKTCFFIYEGTVSRSVATATIAADFPQLGQSQPHLMATSHMLCHTSRHSHTSCHMSRVTCHMSHA